MQLTISSDEPLDHVLAAVGGLFGVRLTVEEPSTVAAAAGDDDERVTKTRH